MLVHVIDDNASVRRAVKRLLGSVGIDAVTYSSAQQFLDSEPADVPSCLVLDVRMPRLSGLELQDRLIDAGRALPIVFITGHGDIAMAVEAMKKGAVDFLPKPFNDQDLIDAIHRALDQHERLRGEQAEQAEILARLERLTPREREVMEHVITGLLNKQVAGELGTTEKTIKVHRARVMEKMEAASLAELVRLAARVDIHGPPSS
jgi:FixJ family two-component response regulator